MIIDKEVYFEHHGIKGMRWGVRRDGSKRSGIEKAAILAVAGAAFVVSRQNLLKPSVTAVAVGGSSVATAAILDRAGRTRVRDI